MRTKILILPILSLATAMMLFGGSAYASVVVLRETFDPDFFFNFNVSRGSIPSYDQVRGISFKNIGNESVTVSNIVAGTGIPGFTVTWERTSLPLNADQAQIVRATFHASPDLAEGLHRGTLSINATATGGISVTFSEPIRVQITWPNPALEASWEEVDWGLIKAGSNLTKKLIINETMGYKPVSGIELSLLEFGPANLFFPKNLSTIAPFSTIDVPVDISIPTRGLVPSKYFISPAISTNTTASIKVEDASYEIPSPKLILGPNVLDFGSITFEPGKDVATRQVTIGEGEGYTPIEGVNITLSSGEGGWIDFTKIDYILPGESILLSFTLRLPSEASLGVKDWKYSVTSKYGGGAEITGTASVYFPGVEDAIKDLIILSSTINATNLTEELLNNTIFLLENARGETELRDISMVMSVYSGARSLTTLLDQVKDSDLERAGTIVVLANNAFNRIKIGHENLNKPQLKKFTEVCFRASEKLWRENALTIVEQISDLAEGNKESNYRVAAIYYNRGAEIYALLNDPKAEEYRSSGKQMEDLYRESLVKAISLESEGGEDLEKSRDKMIRVLDFYFLLNPFAYDEVSKTYSEALVKYGEAMRLYDIAGEEADAQLLSNEIGRITQEQRIFKNAFVLYGLFWATLFVWFMVRVSLGLQYFRQDEDDIHLGEVVLSKEKA